MIPKFRAYHHQINKMANVIKIDFDLCSASLQFETTSSDTALIAKFSEITLLQSTGITDYNGIEIYEGDIVSFRTPFCTDPADYHFKAAIAWGQYEYSADDEYECTRYGWYINQKWTGYTENTGYCLYSFKNKCIVIGNIYENKNIIGEHMVWR